jgi:hypothetical protein
MLALSLKTKIPAKKQGFVLDRDPAACLTRTFDRGLTVLLRF